MNKEVAFISQKLKEEFELLKNGKFEDKQLYAFIERDEIKIVSIILEWFDHKEYERRFKY